MISKQEKKIKSLLEVEEGKKKSKTCWNHWNFQKRLFCPLFSLRPMSLLSILFQIYEQSCVSTQAKEAKINDK